MLEFDSDAQAVSGTFGFEDSEDQLLSGYYLGNLYGFAVDVTPEQMVRVIEASVDPETRYRYLQWGEAQKIRTQIEEQEQWRKERAGRKKVRARRGSSHLA
jgi:hypothetical protein